MKSDIPNASPDVVTVETLRLVLRQLTPDDLGDLHRMLSDAEVMRFYPSCLSVEETEKWLDGILRDYNTLGFGMFGVTLRETGELIGQAGVMRRETDEGLRFYLAYLLFRDFWGKGYATEAASALVDLAFEQLAAEKVHALIRPENSHSVRLATRLGMTRTGSTLHAGFLHDIYEIDRPQTALQENQAPAP